MIQEKFNWVSGQTLPDRVHLSRGEDKVVRLLLLQHQPHALHIVLGVTPVSHGVKVTQLKTVHLAEVYFRHGPAISGACAVSSARLCSLHRAPPPCCYRASLYDRIVKGK